MAESINRELLPEFLHDVPLPVEVILERQLISVKGILGLNEGSVLKLNRSAGENVDMTIEGRVIGFGEIVVMDNTMGFRVTDLYKEV
jgi:flagellar motor switch protein FliN